MSDLLDEILALENKRSELLAEQEAQAISSLSDITSSLDGVDNYTPSVELLTAVNALNDALGLNKEVSSRTRVSNEDKDIVFDDIIDAFKEENKDKSGPWTLPYTQLSDRLKAYGHQPANLSVFFRKQLDGLESTGQTRNKALVFNGTVAGVLA
jgi:hypothetical protein|tara:strand:+ start:567 stop:1028 length:462 start_codon:yes stop_codon:yes gene_type:complete